MRLNCIKPLCTYLTRYHDVRRDNVRELLIPFYMRLITQIGGPIGRSGTWKDTVQVDGTLIVFAAEHRDYLTIRWMGDIEPVSQRADPKSADDHGPVAGRWYTPRQRDYRAKESTNRQLAFADVFGGNTGMHFGRPPLLLS